jgi:hypothetical protein
MTPLSRPCQANPGGGSGFSRLRAGTRGASQRKGLVTSARSWPAQHPVVCPAVCLVSGLLRSWSPAMVQSDTCPTDPATD